MPRWHLLHVDLCPQYPYVAAQAAGALKIGMGRIVKRQVEIEQVCALPNLAGECPIWNPDDGALYWIDARGKAIQRVVPGEAPVQWKLPKRIGSFGFKRGGGILAAMEDGFHHLDLRVDAGVPSYRIQTGRYGDPQNRDNRRVEVLFRTAS